MKKCNACEITYTDDKKFCKKCGSTLTDDKKVETKETAKKLVFEERLKADPLNLKILREFALFLSDNSMLSDTISIALKILAIDENDQIAKKLLTDAYFRLNKYEQAIESAEHLLAEKPDDTELLKILIDASHASGKHDNAILYCEKLLALEPMNNQILHTKALSLLLSDQIAEASQIFAKLQKEGFKDRHTLIYAGISCSLNNDFEAAIEILNPVLSDKELSFHDTDNNRGFLFMAYCLSQFENTASRVDEWLSKIDFLVLKENYHALDEETYVKLTTSVFERTFASEQPALSRYNIEDLIHKYLKSKSEYLTAQTKDLQAELWYKISLKQVEMKLFDEAQQSLKKSIDLMPFKTEYSEKLKEVSRLHENVKKRKKRKSIIIWSIVIALLLIVVAAFYIDKRQKENKAWEAATTENTSISYQRYLRRYPEGRFSQEALVLKEEALWQKSAEANTYKSYAEYIKEYKFGRYASKAVIAQEEAMWQDVFYKNGLGDYFSYLAYYPNGKYSTQARRQVSHVEPIRPKGQIQILSGRSEPYVFYLEKIGDETHWFRFEENFRYRYSINSQDSGYEIIFLDGDVFKGGPDVVIPSKSRSQLKFRAITPNQIITMQITRIN